jgi:hypothetical protein
MKNSLILVAFFWSVGCAQKNRLPEMKNIAENLIRYLINKDSNSIAGLYNDSYYLNNRKDQITSDCEAFSRIVSKYGKPELKNLVYSVGAHNENVISFTLIAHPDTILNIKECQLVVFFYPDQYYSATNKFLDYLLFREPVFEKNMNLL